MVRKEALKIMEEMTLMGKEVAERVAEETG